MRGITADSAMGRSYTAFSSWAGRRLRPYILFPFLALLAFFMVYPIFMVVYGSFKGGPPGTDAPFSLDGYIRTWSERATIKALITTFALVIPRMAIGVTLAVLLTWLMTRTNMPGRRIFDQLIWLKIFLPPLPMLLAWIILAGGGTGLVNQFLMDVFNLSKPPLDIRSYWGVIVLGFLYGGTMYYLYMAPSFRNMDASLEESARISGASSLTTLRRITVPLLMPAILGIALLVFLFMLASFETELFLLGPKGVYVFTTYIWNAMGKVPVDYPAAMALSSAFLIFVALVVLLQFKILGERQFTTVTGRGFGVRLIDIGPWKWVAFAFVASWFAVGLFLPMTILMLGTFLNTYGLIETGLTLQHWRDAFGDPSTIISIKNTLLIGAMVATMGTVLYGLMSYAYLRTKLTGRKWIEVLSWVPRASPGIVFAVGVLWAVLGGIPGIQFLYGSLFLMALVVVIEGTPTGMRMMNGGMIQLGAELEESARVSGASWLRTMRKVVVPLLALTILNTWLLKFLVATRALVLLLFLYLPASKVLAVHIFERMNGGQPQQAAVLGVVLTAISMAVALPARYIAGKQRQAMGGF